MTSTNSIRAAARPARRESPIHLFSIGHAVRLRDGFGRLSQHAEIYRVTGTLPPQGGSLQYRIRNDDERHERMTTQDSLEPVDISQSRSGAALIKRTFGHG